MSLVLKVSTSGNVRVCITCEGLLDEGHFDRDSPICKLCAERLRKEYNVAYSPPVRSTIREAYLALVEAIRYQSVLDNDLEEFEMYWVESEPWGMLWDILKEMEDKSTSVRNDFNSMLGEDEEW